MKIIRSWCVASFCLLTVCSKLFAGGVLINEVMHHPSSGQLGQSFVELYNSGTTTADLSGWRFTKGFQFIFPAGTSMSPGAYLVVASDRSSFTNKYPDVTNYLSGWLAPMSSQLRLETPTAQVVSEVNFANEGDWAARILTTNGFASYGHYGWVWDAPHDGQAARLSW
jgi:hypothetical protein